MNLHGWLGLAKEIAAFKSFFGGGGGGGYSKFVQKVEDIN